MILDYKKYAQVARQVCGDSCVLVKNDRVLPLKSDAKISLFGRAQMELYYCGTGSGGMVNLPYVVQLTEALEKKRTINQHLVKIYQDYIETSPFDKGQGWAQEPWSQVEMPLDEATVKTARVQSDVAVMVIGRSAGEDKDAAAQPGSYYLTPVEQENMKLISAHFDQVAVVLNVGNIIETDYSAYGDPGAILYAWHGGCESGNGYADVLCGEVNPSGSLPDTVGITLEANSSNPYFGGTEENFYGEDIFVGYRYAETFAPESVLYPFGFGLSYTEFTLTPGEITQNGGDISATVTVKNTGKLPGKKSVQLYVEAPNGMLGKAKRVLCGFGKTKVLPVDGEETLSISTKEWYFSSYDDQKFHSVLESGTYTFVAGFDVRNCQAVGRISYQEDKILEKLTQSLAPTKAFDRLVAVESDGKREKSYQPAPLRGYAIAQRIADEEQAPPPKTDKGYTFAQVQDGSISAYDLACELTDFDLICMSRGEGMCSPKVTPGTAGCFGGVTEALVAKGIPLACCADGPSGIRMDSGTMAFSIPNGTALSSTFDVALNETLFQFLGLELSANRIDTILGPGINIHRNPLCGRNFEYFSEDPFLTGKMACAQLAGLHAHGVTGTIKHFTGNNQENGRRIVDTVVSERALREIYLKGFEIAVKEGGAHSIMTAYNPVNGIQAASSFDLTTQILRNQWDYQGLVMTDWWAECNVEGEKGLGSNTSSMIIAQNELYMVNGDAQSNSNKDNAETALAEGKLSRFVLVRNGANVIKTLTKFNCAKEEKVVEIQNKPEEIGKIHFDLGTFQVAPETTSIDCSGMNTQRNALNHFTLHIPNPGRYQATFDLEAEAVELAQISVSASANGTHVESLTLKGQTRKTWVISFEVLTNVNTYFDLYFGESGMKCHSFEMEKVAHLGLINCPVTVD